MSAAAPLVVEVDRSGLVESAHQVDVAVTDRAGALVAWAGEPETVAYLRSSAKPVQALTCLENGWVAPGPEQLAIACASHNGEPPHVEAVRATLAAAGVDEEELRCPPAWPSLPGVVAATDGPARIFHNCSGKHAAMLATSAANGWAFDDYRASDHPMQRAALATIERLAGRAVRHAGIDGCGVQTFAFTLAESAAIFGRLMTEAAGPLDAMTAHPFLLAGNARLDTAIMTTVPRVVIKGGAEGIVCALDRDSELGIALKSRDGTQRGRDVATIAVLQMLGVVDGSVAETLAPHADPPVLGGERRVGSIRVRGDLQRA